MPAALDIVRALLEDDLDPKDEIEQILTIEFPPGTQLPKSPGYYVYVPHDARYDQDLIDQGDLGSFDFGDTELKNVALYYDSECGDACRIIKLDPATRRGEIVPYLRDTEIPDDPAGGA